MGDTANGSWGSAELGGYILREEARNDAMQHPKRWVIQVKYTDVWYDCDTDADGEIGVYNLKAEAQDVLDEIIELGCLHPNCYRIVEYKAQ